MFDAIKQLQTKHGDAAFIKRVEWIVAVLLSAVVLFLLKLGAFIQRHTVRAGTVVPKSKSVNEHENVSLLAAEGWHD